MTTTLIDLALNFTAIAILVFGMYARRHGRKDLVAAFLGVNVGVLAVSSVLATAAVGLGVGLGLFGVLSIIRLRSDELSQSEIAYYFSALAIGLLGGLSLGNTTTVGLLMLMILVLMYLGDHPKVLGKHRRQVLVLDRAYTDENLLRAELEQRLGAVVTSLSIAKTDLVNDTTMVDVRYRVTASPAPAVEQITTADASTAVAR